MDAPITSTEKLTRETLVDRLAGQLRQQILSGRIDVGQALPSERELCDAFGVGRTTVRESLHRLHAAGFVERRGSQLVVVDLMRLPAEEVDCAALAARLSVKDVFEVRELLEAKAVALAAKNWVDDDLDPVRATLERMRTDDAEQYHAAHMEFHLGILRLAKNPVLLSVYEASSHLFFKLPGFWRVFGQRDAQPALVKGQINGWKGHAELLAAIEARDVDESVRLSDHMLQQVERAILRRMGAGS